MNACQGHRDMVQYLHQHGADLNIRSNTGDTAVMLAVNGGHGDIVQCLVQAGADLNLRTKQGWTAVMMAAHCGHGDIVR